MTELTLEQMKANRKLWVEALRSGKYKKARGRLHRNDAFCCLGVACIIAGETVDALENYVNLGNLMRVMDFFGLRDDTGVYSDDGYATCLAEKNDGGVSFKTIADIIESEPPGLFVDGAAR